MQTATQDDASKLDGGFWSFYLAEPDAKMSDVWKTEDNVLICTGSHLGYLYSTAEYDNFTFKLEWRWPPDGEPGKGGVLIHMTGEHKIWPKSLEPQINAGDAGDFWGLGGYDVSTPVEPLP